MRKLLILMMLPAAAFAQDSYTVSGKISGLKVPAKAYLSYGRGEDAFNDSVDIKKGLFTFKGSVSEPVQAFLTVRRNNEVPVRGKSDYMPFYIENAKITFAAKDSIKNATIKGAVAEQESRELDALTRPLTNSIIRLQNEFSGKPKDEAYKRAGDSVAYYVAEIKNIKYRFVESHLHTFMGLYVFNTSILDSKFNPAKEEPLFKRFTPELQASALGKHSQEKIDAAKKRQTGVAVTDFTQNDLNDKPFTLSSLRGKYVLVDFWASWCVPCRAENPHLVKAYQALKDRNFEVVGVSLDQGKEAWAAAVQKDGLPWIHVSDLKGWKNDVATMYGINSVPQNILIDPKGMIIGKNLRGEDLTEKLSALIK